MTTSMNPDHIYKFVEFADSEYAAYEPYTVMHNSEFTPSDLAFGGNAQGYGSSQVKDEFSFVFEPMRVDEYNANLKGVDKIYTLDPDADPGGDPDDFWTMMGEINKVGLGSRELDKRWAWSEFYEAGGKVSGGEWSAGQPAAPWAESLHKTWSDSVNDRLAESEAVRNELAYVIYHVGKAVEDFTNTDIENGADIDASAYEFGKDVYEKSED